MARVKSKRRDPSAQKAAQPRDPNGRSQVMATRVTPVEQQRIMTAAVSAHLSPSDYLRQAALHAQVIANDQPAPAPRLAPAKPIALVRELNAIGVNLNQLTRVANASGIIPADLGPVLEELNRVLDRLIDGPHNP
jgi:hypothetical protein